jgi:large subunit ribosomal protein L22
MPLFRYSFKGYDPVLHIKASLREVDISPKAAREVCAAIRGLTIPKAKDLLEQVIEKKTPIPYARYKKEVSHKHSNRGHAAGRYPAKTAKRLLQAVMSLEANSDFKGLDSERVKIIHSAAHRGLRVKAYTPRAFGRSSPSFNTLTHVELVGQEM